MTPAILDAAVSRDPDDDQVLATAIAANADLIVSGDRDLLDLGHLRDIRSSMPLLRPSGSAALRHEHNAPLGATEGLGGMLNSSLAPNFASLHASL